MLGTIALVALAVAGFYQTQLLLVLPLATIVNSFLGLHYPPGKALMLQAPHVHQPW